MLKDKEFLNKFNSEWVKDKQIQQQREINHSKSIESDLISAVYYILKRSSKSPNTNTRISNDKTTRNHTSSQKAPTKSKLKTIRDFDDERLKDQMLQHQLKNNSLNNSNESHLDLN